MKRFLISIGLCLVSIISTAQAQDTTKPQPTDRLELQAGDHIAIVGNALADRFQHSGWLESFIYARHPKHDLVFRNLAVTGDEVATRARSENFGTPDEWLKKMQANV